jgi:flagellar biogenesis protein FliO
MPEWWSKAKMQLDKEIEQTSGSGEVATPTNSAQSSTGQQEGRVPTTMESFGKGASAFCIVIALILLTYYIIGRYGRKTPLFAGANLGTLMGRLFLSPKACLYFIRVKDKVLVVGVTPTSISSVAEMDASAFESAPAATVPFAAAQTSPKPVTNPASDKFLSQLKTFMRTNPPGPRTGREDDEIATLRGDIARLRRELQEGTREQGE